MKILYCAAVLFARAMIFGTTVDAQNAGADSMAGGELSFGFHLEETGLNRMHSLQLFYTHDRDILYLNSKSVIRVFIGLSNRWLSKQIFRHLFDMHEVDYLCRL